MTRRPVVVVTSSVAVRRRGPGWRQSGSEPGAPRGAPRSEGLPRSPGASSTRTTILGSPGREVGLTGLRWASGRPRVQNSSPSLRGGRGVSLGLSDGRPRPVPRRPTRTIISGLRGADTKQKDPPPFPRFSTRIGGGPSHLRIQNAGPSVYRTRRRTPVGDASRVKGTGLWFFPASPVISPLHHCSLRSLTMNK